MAEDRVLSSTDAKRLSRDWRRKTDVPLAVLLERVQTPFNVGAVIRTAAALRVDHLWLAAGSATPEHDKTTKTSLGTERLLPWTEVGSVTDAVAAAREAGMQLVAVELAAGGTPVFELDLTGPTCLVLGHEDRGLSPAALASCAAVGYVPLPGKVGSLNVATAASIALYETRRQQWTA